MTSYWYPFPIEYRRACAIHFIVCVIFCEFCAGSSLWIGGVTVGTRPPLIWVAIRATRSIASGKLLIRGNFCRFGISALVWRGFREVFTWDPRSLVLCELTILNILEMKNFVKGLNIVKIIYQF